MYRNLVLSGGAFKGVSFIGCCKYLEEKNMLKDIKTLVGSSAGAMICFLLCCGYKSSEMTDIVKDSISRYMQKDLDLDRILNIYYELGFDDGNFFTQIFYDIVKQKFKQNDINFIDFAKLTGKNLVICGSNLTKNRTEYFCVDKTPNMSVVKALRISISLPIIFAPIIMNDCIYSDGCVFNEFPIEFLSKETDPFRDTIGIRIKWIKPPTNDKNNRLTILSYIGTLVNAMNRRINDKPEDLERNNVIIDIVYPDTGYSFDLSTLKIMVSNSDLENHIKQGYDTIKTHFASAIDQAEDV